MRVYRVDLGEEYSVFIRANTVEDAAKAKMQDMVVWHTSCDPLFRSCELPRRVDVASPACSSPG